MSGLVQKDLGILVKEQASAGMPANSTQVTGTWNDAAANQAMLIVKRDNTL